jgi:hypothetical protein
VRAEAEGQSLYEDDRVVDDGQLADLRRALGTESAAQTATLVPFFGPTVGGEATVTEGLGLDLSRALLGGIEYDWRRPFEPGERVHVSVHVESVVTKGSNQFGVLVAEFTGADGDVIQRQSTTFIERGGQ